MPLDQDLSVWIVDFLLRRPASDDVVSRLMTYLPPDDADYDLKQRWLLRFLHSEVSNGNVHETFLDALEAICSIDQKAGVRVRESMLSAYRAVAVYCTVKFLGVYNLMLGKGKDKYLDAVERIWKNRIAKLEGQGSQLATCELNRWKGEILKAALDDEVAESLAKMNTLHEALEGVKTYLGEAMSLLGPTLLDSAIGKWDERKSNDKENVNKNGLVREKGEKKANQSVKRTEETTKDTREDNDGDGNNNVDPSCSKNDKLPSPEVSEVHGVLKPIVMDMELDAVVQYPLPDDDWCVAQDVVCKMQPKHASIESIDATELEKDRSEKDGNVNNEVAASVVVVTTSVQEVDDFATISREEMMMVQEGGNSNVDNHIQRGDTQEDNGGDSTDNIDPSCGKTDNFSSPEFSEVQEVLKSIVIDMERFTFLINDMDSSAEVQDSLPDGLCVTRDAVCRGQPKNASRDAAELETKLVEVAANASKNVPILSLMERNHTARAFEWEDDVTPKKHVISPLKIYSPKRICVRRAVRRWTTEEEETLFQGVKRFGKGNWKHILDTYPDKFDRRTAVDLKDKWRNMGRYGKAKD